jgi:type I restriction enzyme S subunit
VSQWPTATLDELLKDLIDRRGVTPLKLGSDFTVAGHRVISAKVVKGGSIDLTADEPRFVDAETYGRWMRTPLKPGDVVLTSEAPLGEVAYIHDELQWCLGQRLFGLRPNARRINGRYLFYALQLPQVRGDLLSRATGTTAQGIRQSELRKVLIPTPPLDVQEHFGSTLADLDDKIELNRRMSHTLESMAQAIFNFWFIEQTPEEEKASELIEKGLLVIGDGYRAKNDELGDEGLPFIRAAELNNGFDTEGADRLLPDRQIHARAKLSAVGDVAFTSKGTVGRFARVSRYTEPFVYSPQVCFWRSLQPSAIHPALLYCWMRSDAFISQVYAAAGQTDMAPYVSLRDQRAMTVPTFGDSQQAVGDRIAALLDMAAAKQAEGRVLARTRDVLLPKLLSGQLPVPDIVAEEAAMIS